MLLLGLLLCALRLQTVLSDFVATLPVVNNVTTTFTNGTVLSVTSWHGRNTTSISWTYPAAAALDKIVVYEDKRATSVWLRTWNPLFPNVTDEVVDFDNATSIGDWCDQALYAPDKWGAFHSAAVLAASDVSAANKSTWFYTSTAGQNATIAAVAAPHTTGTIKVVLAEVGLFRVCLVPAGSLCYPSHCVTAEIYQPPEDYIEVDATSITEKTFTRFNLATIGATPFDWYWTVGNMPLNATPASLASAQTACSHLLSL
jgi:hypothetical protein